MSIPQSSDECEVKAPTVYEISNPSDPYTLSANDLATAAIAVLLLGRGHYGLMDRYARTVVPIFLFGGVGEWWIKRFGSALDDAYRACDKLEVARCLDSVVIGSFTERTDYEAVMAGLDSEDKRRDYAATWHDQRRSSLNDIGARAKALAVALRAKGEES